jgi:eukaryotic-like serine/threonine-protein kinase
MPNFTGQSIGRYHILEQLGEGGMATVYKAYDTRLEREVAVKVIRLDQFTPATLGRVLKRFEREAKALGRLIHPNIVHVNDYGEHEGVPYLVMDYLPGGTLKPRLGQPMPWEEAVRLLIPIAQALEYAHEQAIVHRDVKPSNILLTVKGQPMLTDFGIAKLLEGEQTQSLTGSGVGVGTPEYISPEQWTGQAGPLADLYSLGVVLYELVTGRKPYTADTPAAIMLKQATSPLPRPRQFVPGLPEAVEKVLFKALAKEPGNRYPDMDTFIRALEGLLSRQPARPPSRQVLPPVPLKKPLPSKSKVTDSQATFEPMETQTNPEPKRLPEALLEQTLDLRTQPPIARRYWMIGLVVLGVVGIGVLGGLLLKKPTTFFLTSTPIVTQTPTGTQASMETHTPTSTLTPNPTDTPTITPTPGIGTTWTRPADKMVMVFVPEGSFNMGTTKNQAQEECKKVANSCYIDRYADAQPAHNVFLNAFWIDKTDITNYMYALCVQAGSCQPPHSTNSKTRSSYYGNSQYDNYPVIYVNWGNANDYCAWAGGRLPSEAEWEKAARGTDGRRFPWGFIDPNCTLANYISFCAGDTTSVDNQSSGASPYGALDMAGNVWQWVADWYAFSYYSYSPQENPTGPETGQERVLRGGDWSSITLQTLSFFRLRRNPLSDEYSTGFRCARSINP